MRRIVVTSSLVAVTIVATLPSNARAQEEGLGRHMAAPTNAFELKIGTEYTQGFGLLTPSQSIHDVAGAGLGAHLDLDARVDPYWSIGVQGEYQEFNANTNTNSGARGLAGNVGVTWHTMPFVVGDPWIRLGTGYRMLWSVDPTNGGPTQLVHGFELAKATIGYDLRATPGVALAPVIGADIDLFTWQYQGGTGTALSSAQVGMFVFGGLQARFDVGETVERTQVAKR
jgi:hypothetical protein